MYDYIIEKPPLNEDTLAHYGVKGMKWRKHIKGKYYSLKSKAGEYITKRNRKKIGVAADEVSEKNGKKNRMSGTDIRGFMNYNKNPEFGYFISGNYNSSSRDAHNKYPGTGSNIEAGIAAGRERAKKRKKK